MINSEIRTYIHDNKEALFGKLAEARKGNKYKEENFRQNHTIILDGLFQSLKIDGNINAENEFTVLEGRIDSLYGNFLIEYKYPTRIASTNTAGNLKFVEQVQRQMNGFHQKTGVPFHKIMGVVFDGYYVIYIKNRLFLCCIISWNTTKKKIKRNYCLNNGRHFIERYADIISQFVNAYVAWFISGHILERINIPRYYEENILHNEIAGLAKKAHLVVGDEKELEKVGSKLNEKVNKLLLGYE